MEWQCAITVNKNGCLEGESKLEGNENGIRVLFCFFVFFLFFKYGAPDVEIFAFRLYYLLVRSGIHRNYTKS